MLLFCGVNETDLSLDGLLLAEAVAKTDVDDTVLLLLLLWAELEGASDE